MSRLRTAVALLFHVLLLHASVLGGGMACAPAWTAIATAEPAAHASHGAPSHAEHGGHLTPVAHADPADTDRTGADGRQAPPPERVPTHCAAAAGCVVAAPATSSTADDALRVVRSVAEAGRVSLPPSIRPAPETPPPRA